MPRWIALAVLAALMPLRGSVARTIEDPAATIRAVPVPLDRDDPAHHRVGALDYLAGWRLSSDNPRFGGLSSMVPDGRGGFVAISDEGGLFRFRVDGSSRLRDSSITWLPGAGPLIPKKQNDIESVARDPVSGAIWLGYEGRNMIRRLDPALGRIEAEAKPPEMRHWPENTGAEAMERLSDGRFLVLAEAAPEPGHSTQALLFPGDPTDPANRPVRFRYRPPHGFRPTEARQLPDGRVLVLNRRFNLVDGLAAALTILDPALIRAGEIVSSREIARLEQPLTLDNMEALALTQERGRTILWIASDDNFLWIQRTLLLKFALADDRLDPGSAVRGRPRP